MSKQARFLTIVIAAVVLAALVVGAVFLICYAKPQATEGSKTIVVTVVDDQKAEKTYTLHTDEQYLADALLEAGVIAEKSADGLYTVIDGITASWEPNHAWWCLTKDGEMVNEGLNTQPIADGERYEITYTID